MHVIILHNKIFYYLEADIDDECLVALNESNVAVLGLSLRHRLKLLGYIEELKVAKEKIPDIVQVISAYVSIVTDTNKYVNTNETKLFLSVKLSHNLM